jgi:DNA replication protein DnaC
VQYPAKIYERADDELRLRRLSAQNELGRHIERLRTMHPGICQLRDETYTLGVKLGRALIADNAKEHGRLLTGLKAARMAITSALAAAGLPEDYLEAQYACKKCGDKGLHKGQYCGCRKKLLNRFAYEMLSEASASDGCDFDTFDLGYYTDNRQAMSKLLKSCRRYAAGFSHESPSLLFLGPTGLGKTHLALAIAREVVFRGNLVMYANAVSLVERVTDSAMGDSSEDEYRQLVYGCDLLVIDDLGAEFKTHITQSKVFDLIDTRRRESKPTIVTTNLTLAQIGHIYEPRVLSRLGGDYVTYQFSGRDIRFQRKERLQNGKAEKREAPGAQ